MKPLAIIQFSGGKDSIAALHVFMQSCEDYQPMLYYHDMGDSFPHVIEFVLDTGREYGIPVTIGMSKGLWADGWPSDIVPVWSDGRWMEVFGRKTQCETLLQSSFDCCNKSLWQPMHKNMRAMRPAVIVRGAKATDDHTNIHGSSFMDNGIAYLNPLWRLTDDDVFKYIEDNDLRLPIQYAYGCNHSLDCMRCTGWFDNDNEHSRLSFTKDHYPNQYKDLNERLGKIRVEIVEKTKLYLGE